MSTEQNQPTEQDEPGDRPVSLLVYTENAGYAVDSTGSYMKRLPNSPDEAKRGDGEWLRLLDSPVAVVLHRRMFLNLEGIGGRVTTPVVAIIHVTDADSPDTQPDQSDTQTGVSTTTSYKPEPHRSSYEDHPSPALGLALGGALGVGYLPLF